VKPEWVVKNSQEIAERWSIIPQMKIDQINYWRRDYIQDAKRMLTRAEEREDQVSTRLILPRR
jgi:hypothetical protein